MSLSIACQTGLSATALHAPWAQGIALSVGTQVKNGPASRTAPHIHTECWRRVTQCFFGEFAAFGAIFGRGVALTSAGKGLFPSDRLTDPRHRCSNGVSNLWLSPRNRMDDRAAAKGSRHPPRLPAFTKPALTRPTDRASRPSVEIELIGADLGALRVSHYLVSAMIPCSSSSVNLPSSTRVRRNTKYVSSTSQRQ